MTSQQVHLIRVTFRTLTPLTDQVAALFYARLFELDPSLRGLFHGGLKQQGRKLMDMLSFAVNQLDQPAHLEVTLRELGIRHAGYGAKDTHYHTVGEALLWTLQQVLGGAFTPDVRTAWADLYRFLSEAMRAHGTGHQAA